MKRIILFLIPFFYALASCHKEKQPLPANMISAKVGGSYEKFAVNVTVTKDPPSPIVYKYGLSIKARTFDSIMSDEITIFIFSHNAPITTWTYKFADDPENTPTNAIVHFTRLGSEYIYTSDSRQPNPGTITVTSVTDHNIKGTFSADLFNAYPYPLQVTDGEFNIDY